MFKKIEEFDKKLENAYKKEILVIGMIMVVTIIFRILITPWNLPSPAGDVIVFFTEAFNFSHNNYDFFNRRFLWPFLLSIFFRFFEFQTYIEYVNIIRIISIGLSVITIPIFYLISKKFVTKKYSILAASFFAFNIQIIQNSTWGITEPLFLLLALISIYFMFHHNSKYIIFSFIFAGLAFDTRLNGIVVLIMIIIFCCSKIKSKKKLLSVFLIGIFSFLIITIPHYYETDSQNIPIINQISGTVNPTSNNLNPHLVSIAKIFLNEEQLDPNSNNFHEITFLEKYFYATIKEGYHFFIIHLQLLIFLLPMGLFLIFKNRKNNELVIFSGIIISLIIAIPQYTMSSEIRNLLLILPLSTIIGIIGLKNILENKKSKNIIISLIIISLIISSAIILYPNENNEMVLEKEKFGKYVSLNYSGKISGDLLYHIENNLIDLNSFPLKYKEGKGIITDYSFYTIFDENQLIKYLKNNEISFLIIDNKVDNRYLIFEDIFENEKKYPYLIKTFDSEQKYQILKVKIFKVDFENLG